MGQELGKLCVNFWSKLASFRLRVLVLFAWSRDLQETYQQLVGGNLLTDAEFWKGHQDILRTAPAATKQRVGFSTAMIGDVRPGSDAGRDKVCFRACHIKSRCHRRNGKSALLAVAEIMHMSTSFAVLESRSLSR